MPNISFSFDNRTAVLTFDREGSSANLFDDATLAELDRCLDEIEGRKDLDGLLIRSAKPSIFIAGADLHELSAAGDDDLASLIRRGQRVFNRLADLPFATVAAIHGACAGGGFELALACDWRVASDSPKTRIGLPETQLGILPAWGGTTRLTELLGLPKALPILLGGKLHKPGAARRKGLVDAVVPPEHVESHARTYLEKGKRPSPRLRLPRIQGIARIIRRRARRDLLARTRGLYPGPEAALDVAAGSVGRSRDFGQREECEAILRLAKRPETTQLIRLFFLRERAKKHRYVEAEPRAVERTAVIGAGVMGSGIAYWLSTRGLPVILRDVSPAAIAKGMDTIDTLYREAEKRHVIDRREGARGRDRIHPAAGPVPLRRCDLVIEAAVEKLETKKNIFADLSERARPDAVLATNTSALPIRELAGSIDEPGRLLGLHFFNPVHRMQLVEVVRAESTSDETVATGVAFVRRLGKLPVVVRDSPGFLVNRILMPYLVKAAALFEAGGDPEVIDRAMLDFGMPMGPLRLLDEVGLDVALDVARTLAEAFPERMEIPRVVEKLAADGQLGKKSGGGFYTYGKSGGSPNAAAFDLRAGNQAAPGNVRDVLADLMTAEARRCLDEGVAESADDIDLAMVLGTGYAPFRGGPLAHGDTRKTTT
jgi:3-hydroxyacyl-CoA dehydrogenase/enoyl-CoA hydratase/3-hydroxybutyryl-CoA epimerase